MEYQSGIVVQKCTPELIEHIANTPDVSVMELEKGQHIHEHTHGNSMYFARNVKGVTIENHTHTIPPYSWVFIPKGVSHGWIEVHKPTDKGHIFSYHTNHKKYSVTKVEVKT